MLFLLKPLMRVPYFALFRYSSFLKMALFHRHELQCCPQIAKTNLVKCFDLQLLNVLIKLFKTT